MDSKPASNHGEGRGGAFSIAYAIEPRERFKRPDKYGGYAVCDPLGNKVGSVEKVFVNGGGEPEYIRIKMGPLGLKSVLLPVLYVAVDEKRRVLTLQ